ncbi:hypothetical protein N0V83_002118 [Neocucurbitaria cava]|uniref:Uncharacterized protein n=1 Tax=Neocucurbitaria cava TaxID=798079 RepID=A0A9W9CQM9_9PLEO|nr:hypothetical protein N0V83_002118 [Neocucurbitaria cava]
MSYSSSNSSMTSLSSTDEKISMLLLPATDLLVRDFGWPSSSARYRGDHTPDSNPDWEHDPLDSAEAKEEAYKKMEKSYAIYMGNLEGARAVPKKEKKPVWARFLPRDGQTRLETRTYIDSFLKGGLAYMIHEWLVQLFGDPERPWRRLVRGQIVG